MKRYFSDILRHLAYYFSMINYTFKWKNLKWACQINIISQSQSSIIANREIWGRSYKLSKNCKSSFNLISTNLSEMWLKFGCIQWIWSYNNDSTEIMSGLWDGILEVYDKKQAWLLLEHKKRTWTMNICTIKGRKPSMEMIPS